MTKGQNKLYRLGQKPKGGGQPVKSGVQQGATAKHQQDKTHKVKGRTVNHNRSR